MRVLLLLVVALAAVEARFRSVRPAPSDEFVSSECYQHALPFVDAIRSTLHARRQSIRKGCHDNSYQLVQRLMNWQRAHNESVPEHCRKDPHKETCRYFGAHMVRQSYGFVQAASAVKAVCAGQLGKVVEDMRDEATEMIRVLNVCAPRHACYLYKSVQGYKRHTAKLLHKKIHGHARDVCSSSGQRRLTLPGSRRESTAFRHLCEHYNLSQGILSRINKELNAQLDQPLMQRCKAIEVSTTTVAPATTAAATTTKVQPKPKETVIVLLDTGDRDEELPEDTKGGAVIETTSAPLSADRDSEGGESGDADSGLSEEVLFLLHSLRTRIMGKSNPTPQTLVVDPVPQQTMPKRLQKRFRHHKRAYLVVVGSTSLLALCAILALVIFAARRRRRANRVILRNLDRDVLQGKNPLASADDRDLAALMQIQQRGFENPAYSFYEGLPDEKC